jgi:cell division protein FtsW
VSRAGTLRRSDLAPAGPVVLHTGLDYGWERHVLVVTTFALLCFGLVNLYSASQMLARRMSLPDYHFVLGQGIGAVAGAVLFIVASRIPYRFWQRMAWPLLTAAWILLVIIVLPGTESIAPERNGARRWLDVGVSIQPTEIAKFALIVWTAMLATRKRDQFRSLRKGFLPFLLIWGVVALPIILEPSLSVACVTLMASVVVLFAAGARPAHFTFVGLLALPVLLVQLSAGFRAERIASFMSGNVDNATGFQVRQSLIALGSGGLTGVGFGQGHQKFGFLPEAQNDFIFAMIGEEWGLLGVLILVALYLTLILIGFRIARRATDTFGQLLAIGLTSLIGLHAFLHMGVGFGIVPATGLPLPLVSDGRSNLLMTMMSLGVLLSVARAADGGSPAVDGSEWVPVPGSSGRGQWS